MDKEDYSYRCCYSDACIVKTCGHKGIHPYNIECDTDGCGAYGKGAYCIMEGVTSVIETKKA